MQLFGRKRAKRGLLDCFSDHIAILNSEGEIIEVNNPWKQFARENNCTDGNFYVGTNYLAVCERALLNEHDEIVEKALQGIQAVLRGEGDDFLLEYPCNSPTEMRWFTVRARHFEYEGEIYVIVIHEDITSRKLAEKANEEAYNLYRQLYENSMDAILITAPDGRILAANPATSRMFGRTEDEIRKVGRSGLVDVADLRLTEGLKERERTGKFHGELTGLRRDGTKFPIDVTTSLFNDRDGNLLTSMIIRDITERKQTEIALQESRNLFRQLAEGLPDTIYTFNVEQRQLTYFNRDSFLGYDRDELISQGSIQKHIHPEDAAALSAHWQRVLGRETLEGIEYRVQNKNGPWEWVDSREIITSSNPDGTPKEIMVVLRVITDRKRADEQIAYHAKILENVNDVVIGSDENYVITYWNAAAERTFGWKPMEVIGRPTQEVLRTTFIEGGREDSIREINETGKWKGEVIQYKKDNLPLMIEANIMTIRDRMGRVKGYVSANRDISERKQAEEKLTQAYQAIEGKNRELEMSLEREAYLARTDGLTGIKNYRHFFEIATHEIAMANRYQHSLSVLLLDIDKFKNFNDSMGHQFGDEMLKHVAQIAKQRLRETDVLARYGGEEFIVVLPNTTSKEAFLVAEDMRKHIAASGLDSKNGRVSVTVSIGVSEIQPSETQPKDNPLDKLIRFADKALYKAKETGRNRTVVYSKEINR